jgi:uncharacterized protein HemX
MGKKVAELSENQEQNEEASIVVHRSSSGLWLGIIIILIVIILAGAGYFFLQQLRDEQEDIDVEINKGDQRLMEINKQVTSYQEQLASLQSQLTTLDAEVASKGTYYKEMLTEHSKLHQEKLDNIKRELSIAIKQLQRQLSKTRGDWLIADAEYLLSVANQRLQLMGDIKTTIEALEAADQRLRESGDAAVFKVRDQLVDEIAILKEIKEVDVVGIYAAIQSLSGNVDKLSVFLPFAGKDIKKGTIEKVPEKQGDTQVNESEGLLDAALEELEGIVTIRHSDKPIDAILTPHEAHFIQQQMQVKLEMVKLSLVQQNESLYHANLADAKQWLQENFTMNANAKLFMKELDRLQQIKIRSQLPDISKSLKMLRDIVKLRIESDKALYIEDEAGNLRPLELSTDSISTSPAQDPDVEKESATQPEQQTQPEVESQQQPAVEAEPEKSAKPADQ